MMQSAISPRGRARRPRPSRSPPSARRPTRRGRAACNGRRCWCRSPAGSASGRDRPPRSSIWPSRSRQSRRRHAPASILLNPAAARASASSQSPRGTPPTGWPGRPACRRAWAHRRGGSAAGQPVRMVDVVEAEAPLDAEPALVGRAVAAVDAMMRSSFTARWSGSRRRNRGRGCRRTVSGTSRCAVRARRPSAIFRTARRWGRPARIPRRRRRSRAHRVGEIEHRARRRAAITHADHIVDLHLAAGALAQAAGDAGVEIDRDGGVARHHAGHCAPGRATG
jgi:hypothetical protein